MDTPTKLPPILPMPLGNVLPNASHSPVPATPEQVESKVKALNDYKDKQNIKRGLVIGIPSVLAIVGVMRLKDAPAHFNHEGLLLVSTIGVGVLAWGAAGAMGMGGTPSKSAEAILGSLITLPVVGGGYLISRTLFKARPLPSLLIGIVSAVGAYYYMNNAPLVNKEIKDAFA